jgi:putative ABC transport system permease protein
MKVQNGLIHLIKAALADFKRNKIRTFLTSLGIMIGVLSVVMLIALGLGLKNYLKQQFESLGSNMIIIMPGSGLGGEEGGGFAGAFGALMVGIEFDEKDVTNLERIGKADYVVPVFFKSSVIKADGEKESGYVMGTNEDFFKVLNLEPLAGSFWEKSDIQARSKKAVLGYVVAEKLFGNPEDAQGRTIRFNNQRFKVVGVAKKKGDNEQDNAAIIPYKTTYGSLNPEKTFFTIYMGVDNEDNVAEVKGDAKRILERRYDEDEFSVSEQTEILETVNQIFNIVNGVLVAIGSISLVVGGIGIMNIMYATVTERIKEVGIRRAVGATEADILKQFLTESVLLSVFGGVLGLLLSTLIVLAVRPFFPVAINLLAVVITFVISSAIGIFFGVFPARRAAKLPPIEAIRYE